MHESGHESGHEALHEALHELELLVIGAGPGGIAAAVEARLAGVPAEAILVLEKGEAHSVSIRKLYPEAKPVTANYKGIEPRCEGALCLADTSKDEVLAYLDQAIARHGVRVSYGEEAHTVVQEPAERLVVRTSKGSYASRVVVVAVGIFGRPAKPSYPLPKTLPNRVLFDVTSVAIHLERVLVVGGGDSASEYCQFLVAQDNHVTLAYRGRDFWRMTDGNRQALLALEKSGALTVFRDTDIAAVRDVGGKPDVAFAPGSTVAFDRLVYALGGSTPQGFLAASGVEFRAGEPVLSETLETSVRGLFLTGDLMAGKRGGSIVSAFNASHRVIQRIRPQGIRGPELPHRRVPCE